MINKIKKVIQSLGISDNSLVEYNDNMGGYIIYYYGEYILIRDYELEKQSVRDIVRTIKRLVERG